MSEVLPLPIKVWVWLVRIVVNSCGFHFLRAVFAVDIAVDYVNIIIMHQASAVVASIPPCVIAPVTHPYSVIIAAHIKITAPVTAILALMIGAMLAAVFAHHALVRHFHAVRFPVTAVRTLVITHFFGAFLATKAAVIGRLYPVICPFPAVLALHIVLLLSAFLIAKCFAILRRYHCFFVFDYRTAVRTNILFHIHFPFLLLHS